MKKARLQEEYVSKIRGKLQKDLGLKNIMEVPRVSQIVLNIGAGKDIIAIYHPDSPVKIYDRDCRNF